jgi:stage V sporulation protein S
MVEVLRVSAQTSPKSAAGAVKQTVKAIAIRGYLTSVGIDLVSMPASVDISLDGEDRTAIKFIAAPR